MTNLSLELAKIIKGHELITVDEFFDRFDIPQEDRTEFGFAAIVKNAWDILQEEKQP